MKESDKRLFLKANLLILFIGLLAIFSLGQNESTPKCEETDYDCLINEYGRSIASKCDAENYYCRVAELTKIIESNPNAGAAYVYRGRYFFVKEPNRAIQDFNKAIELNPKYFQTYISLGLLYSSVKKEHDKAVVELTRAIESASQETDYYRKRIALDNAYENRAFAYLQKRDFDNAIADYNKIIEMNPKSGSGYSLRAAVYFRQNDFDKALADYNKVIDLNPNNADGYSNRGNVYSAQKDYDKAFANYDKAIELAPNRWLYRYIRGWLYYNNGKKSLAEADFKKAKELETIEDNQDEVKIIQPTYPQFQ